MCGLLYDAIAGLGKSKSEVIDQMFFFSLAWREAWRVKNQTQN